MPQSLVMRYTTRNGATAYQVFRNNNGSFYQFGSPGAHGSFGPAAADSQENCRTNAVIQFGEYFYALFGQWIMRYDPSTDSWSTTGGLDKGGSSTITRAGGFYLGRGPSGAPRVIHPYNQGGGALILAWLDSPGGAWSSVNTGAGSNNNDNIYQHGIVFNNDLHVHNHNVRHVINIATLSVVNHLLGGNSHGGGGLGLTRARNRLFLSSTSGAGNAYNSVREYTGSGWSVFYDGTADQATVRLGGSGQPNNSNTNFHTMHYDEASDSLIMHGWQEAASAGAINPGGNGWYVVQLPFAGGGSSIGTPINITDTVVPTPFLRAPSGPTPSGDVGFAVEVDADSDPLNPITYIWVRYSNGSWSKYRWAGVGSPMVFVGSGGDRGLSIVSNPSGGGQYFYDGSTTVDPAYHIQEVQARTPLIGGTRIYFTVWQFDETNGSPTPIDIDVGAYFGTTQATPDNLATLSAVAKVSGPGSTPAIDTAGKITNVTADGMTVYSADWDANTDGVNSGTLHTFMLNIEL